MPRPSAPHPDRDPVVPAPGPPPDDGEPDPDARARRAVSPDEVGNHLARLVWESFADFVADGDRQIALADLGVRHEDGVPEVRAVEEALIFLMWAHTRAAQLAFLGREAPAAVRRVLDAFHRDVFEDLVANGSLRSYLPIFEQRVGARYADYHAAAERSDGALGREASRHLTGEPSPPRAFVAALTERALAVAEPLRDFLDDVELLATA